MNPIPEHGVVIREAIEWHQRLKEGALDPDARREFRAWLQTPAHVQELARICLIDALLRGGPRKAASLPSLPKNVVDFEAYVSATLPRAKQLAVVAARRFNARAAMAAAVVLAVIVTAVGSWVTADQVIVTRQGRWDKQLLDDGTVVYAGPRTKLRFHFDAHVRSVTLVRGEALFEVAREAERPFVVSTQVGSVQAMGTAFATADVGHAVVVTVAKGKVAVTAGVGAGMQPMLPLSANQQVVLKLSGSSQPVSVNAERELKWIRNWYEYEGEQVGDIITQLNRRHEVKVIVDDPQVTRLRMNALAFRPSQPEDFVAKINQWYADFPQKPGDAVYTPRKCVLHLQRG